MKFRILFSILCICCLVSKTSHAADLASLESQVNQLAATVKDLQRVIEIQQSEIRMLKAGAATPSVSGVQPDAPRTIAGRWNPEIGVVVDAALKLDSPKADEGGADRVSVRELELVLGSAVDPYSRLDGTVAFTEEDGAELEEAYLTRFELPLDTMARIGRFKPRMGKALTLHRDSLDTADEPLVIQRYFGEEGMSKSGVDFDKILDLPTPFVHQLTLGVLEGGVGEGGSAFGSSKRRPTFYGHLKNYTDIGDMKNLELGLTYAVGHKDAESASKVGLLGLDATFIRNLNATQNFKFQGEAFHQNRRESHLDVTSEGAGAVTRNYFDGRLWGAYGLFDFRLNPQWSIGTRLDYVEPVDNAASNPEDAETGYAGYLTFHQSEFARWRFQVNHIDLVTGDDDNQFWIQGTFAIGEHKHKIQ